MEYLITAAMTNPYSLDSAVRALNGRRLTSFSWIARSSETADFLCRYLRQHCDSQIVVCSLTGDWSYR